MAPDATTDVALDTSMLAAVAQIRRDDVRAHMRRSASGLAGASEQLQRLKEDIGLIAERLAGEVESGIVSAAGEQVSDTRRELEALRARLTTLADDLLA